ncbi:MAG: regulatory protein RecX [bacterium]
MGEERDFQRAKELAINLISYRPRSSKEVRSHLIQKGYSFLLADQVVNYLQESDYLNDKEFARKWYLSRLNKGGYGPLLIYKELTARGIPAEDCRYLKERFYPEEREREEALRLIEKKGFNKPMDAHQEKRLYNMLLRRGFSPGLVIEVLGIKK